MAASLTEFEEALQKLITKFENDRDYYLSKDYSEAQARLDFIDPFFRSLGWDVENQAGLPHHEREVLVEKGDIDTDGRPDYNFRINGRTRFFVEAKTPSEHLDETRHIIQAKKYAWNTKSVFFVILTDFEELYFYDASIKPDERKPDEGLLLKLRYDEYLTAAEKLWDFSRDRVAAGSLDALLPRDRRTKRLRIPVDQAFLDEMTGWRAALARNVYKNNRSLTAKQLNEVVQRLLDRIVFIRIAEDRNIIRKYQLREAKEEWEARGGKFHIFEWLNDLFHRVNEDFNGEIFKPHLSEEIKIDSEALAGIIDRLYPPKSPYRFDVIGVELLGSIYERYLGSAIRPKAKRVMIEEKPEVRKAGGVYYTPQYIVDYIVKNTVGKIIEGKTPKQIEKIRILDPACGSGSFLIGAFQYLIDYHVRYLSEHPKEAQVHPLFPDLLKGENGQPRLSVVRKARILRNNLFGVDIDPQAVEITMMSLYLKALEGEKSQLPPKHHLLPELKYNVICGNSLIGPDIYDQGTLFGDAERDRINAFDWYGGTYGGTGVPPVVKHAQDAHATLAMRHGAYLPHWTCDGATYAVCFRLDDSLPGAVIEAWKFEREDIVKTAQQMNRPLSAREEERLDRLFSEKVEKHLDEGRGDCWLRRDDVAQAVAGSLKHFDGERYRLIAWCLMPNHVHAVVQPLAGNELPDILHSWKSFSSKEANRLLGRSGQFWQPEYYDHLIRDEQDFGRQVEYVLTNPQRAGLENWKWMGSGTAVSAVKEHGQHAHATSAALPSIAQVMRFGGFDCVIGNPPYVRIQNMKEWAPFEVEHYKQRYKSASSGNYDIYVVFVEKGLSVLKKGGKLGYILPHKFFNAKYGGPLRCLIAEGKHLSMVIHFGDQQVFDGATNYTCLLFLEKDGKDKFQFAKVNDLDAWRNEGRAAEGVIPASRATASEWSFSVGQGAALSEKLRDIPVKLGEIADIFVGLQTSADDVFILDLVERRPTTVRVKSKALGEDVVLEKGLLFPLVSGTDVKRYGPLPERQFILFPYALNRGAVELIDLKTISKRYPRTAGYLAANRGRLEGREGGRMRGPRWHGYIYLKNMARQSVVKLCVPRLVDMLHAAYDSSGTHFLDNVDVGGITLKPDYEEQGAQFLLGLLNSALLRWYFPFVSAPFRGGWMSANRQFLSQLPIRTINFSDPADKARHDKMVELVERMLELNKQKHGGTGVPPVKEHGQDAHATADLDHEIAATDAEIDNLIYELYGITDEERKIIEGESS